MRRLLLLLLPLTLSAAEARLTHGPMVGRASATTMSVWARFDGPAHLQVRYGLAPDELNHVSTRAATDPEHDFTAIVELTDLEPDRRYYYAIAGAPATSAGSFRTFPSTATARSQDPETNPRGLFNFTFLAGACSDQSYRGAGPTVPALTTALTQHGEEVLFALQHGDWIYEEARETTAGAWRAEHPDADPTILRLAPALAGVWANHRLYLERGTGLAAWVAHVPHLTMYDDHEALNDLDGTGLAGFRGRQASFRDIGVRGWQDYVGWGNPPGPDPAAPWFGRADLAAGSDVLHDPSARFDQLEADAAGTLVVHWGLPTDGIADPKLDQADGGVPNARVYEIVERIDAHHLRVRPAFVADQAAAAYSIGGRPYYDYRVGNCAFFVIDTRGGRGLSRVDGVRDDPNAFMLDERQRAWLRTTMQAAAADPAIDFLFVVSSVNLTIPHTGKGGFTVATKPTDEAWTGYLDERDAWINTWDELAKPVLVITGDLHNAASIRITDNVWEFPCAPLNSGNHNLGSESHRAVTGQWDSFGQEIDVRWSTFFRDDVPAPQRIRPVYALFQVNNTFANPGASAPDRQVAFPHPQVVVRFHDGATGALLYAEAVTAAR